MTNQKKRLIIIDSNSVIHRAYHALPRLATKSGELVNAIYGFLLVFLKAIKEFNPDYIVAVFDVPVPTFRHDKYIRYKAKRPKAPEELYKQIPKVKELLKDFNIPVFEKPGYEADDLVGTISQEYVKKQALPEPEVVILSGDTDVLQLVDKNIKAYILRKGVKDTVLYDEEMIKQKYDGLVPGQLEDYKALRGDPTDNIPGATGIGEKTALELIKGFHDLENLYKELEENSEKAKKVKEKVKEILLSQKEQIYLSKFLVQIKRDVPIEFVLKQSNWREYDRANVTEVLKGYEFFSLISRLPVPNEQEETMIEVRPRKSLISKKEFRRNAGQFKNNLKLW